MNRLLLPVFALLLLWTAAPTLAQQRTAGTITGTVIDADAESPIPSASVAVWRLTDAAPTLTTGAITDADGRFRVEGVRPGRYRVDVSFVGYVTERREDVEVAGGTVDLGTVALAPDVERLEGVEVAAEREQVQIQIDRTVYNTADDPVAAGGNATNVLETIPSVDVDVDGNISLRGSGNVAVLVNGKPAPVSSEFVAAYLRSLPAGSIDRVEVIPNPSARYEPEGMGGIINIVLKENVDRGVGGTVAAGLDSRGGYTGTATVTYGRGPWNLAGSYGFRQSEGIGGGSSLSNFVDNTSLVQTGDEDESETSHNVNLSADYAFSRSTSLTSSVQFGVRDEIEDELNRFVQLDAAQDPMLQYERLVEELSDRRSADVRLGLRHDFGTEADAAHTLNAEARYNRSVNDSEETYTERFTTTPGDLRELQLSQNDRDRDEASFTVDYVRPVGEFRLEAGYKGELETQYSALFAETRDEETGVFEPDTLLNNTFDFDQQIHAAYLQLAREFGPLGVQLGVRAETAQTTFSLQNTGQDYDNDYASVFPSAFLSYQLGDQNVFRASYSRRINRPRTWFLNPFPSLDDPSNPRIGNPSLQPEYVSAFELGYVRYTPWGSLTLTPYYRYTTDAINRISVVCGGDGISGVAAELCAAGPDVIAVRTVENIATNSSYGVEIINSVTGRGALRGLRGYVSVEGFRFVSDGSSSAGDLANDAFGWGGRLNASYALGERLGIGGLDLQANVRYRAPMATEQGRRGAFTFVDFAMRKELLGDRASLTVRLRDPFGLAGFNYVLDQPQLYQEFERDWGAQQVGVTFQYNFGQQQRQRRQQRPDGERGGEGDFEEGEI